MFLLLANILILFVGCFIDTIAAITILVPILLPIVLKLGIDPIHFGLIMTLNLMIGLLHPPLGMVLFVLARVAKLSVERTTMAILPWLVPLLLALVAITYIPELTLWLPKYMGLVEMTSMALAATLFGPEDLRMVERPLDPLASGMVRIRFGAGGICGSDMHYYRHARTGDFVVTSPLVLGHEIAGEVVEIAGAAPGLKVGDRVAVNPSRWCGHCKPLPREPAESVREHLLHGLGLEDAAYAGRLRHPMFDAIPAQCVKIPDHVPYQAAALAEPLAVCLHAVARAGDVSGKRAVLFGAGPIGLLTMLAARRAGIAEVDRGRHRRGAARLCDAARRQSCRRYLRRRGGAEGAGRGASVRRGVRSLGHGRGPCQRHRRRQARRRRGPGRQSAGRADFGAGQCR